MRRVLRRGRHAGGAPRRSGCLYLYAKGDACERRVAPEGIVGQLARASLQTAHRVESARGVHSALLEPPVRLELDACQRVELERQLLRVERHVQVIRCAGVQCREALLFRVGCGGEHNDRHVPRKGGVATQGAADRDAVRVRKVCIHQNDIGPQRGSPLEELAARRHGDGPVPQRLKRAFERAVDPYAGIGEERQRLSDERSLGPLRHLTSGWLAPHSIGTGRV